MSVDFPDAHVLVAGDHFFGAEVLSTLAGKRPALLDVVERELGRRTSDVFGDAARAAGARTRELTPSVANEYDILVLAHWTGIIPSDVLAAVPIAIGYHPSLLPRFKGRHAIADAIASGETVTGGTVYVVTDDIDGGPIVAQAAVSIPPGCTPRELWRSRLAPLGVDMLVNAVELALSGAWMPVSQDEYGLRLAAGAAAAGGAAS